MQETRISRTLPLVPTLAASAALALSVWTACQRQEDTRDAVVAPTVQGERSDAARAPEPGTAAEATPSETSSAQTAAIGSDQKAQEGAEPVKPVKPQHLQAPPQVKRLVVTRAVENREPLAMDGPAPLGEPLMAFIELSHGAEEAAQIVVTFEPAEGQKVGFIELEVPASSPRYRTWARTQNIKRTGEWQVVVSLKDGAELARESFTVAETESGARAPDPRMPPRHRDGSGPA